MKNNRYRRLRAQEMALRDWCAGTSKNPFPTESMEHRVYAQEMARSEGFNSEMVDVYAAYGHADELPCRRDPATVNVRPPLPGFP